jgi:hypothetical protein
MINHTVEFMKKNGVPLTRENYLDYAYLGNPPPVLDAEEEAELPPEVQASEAEPEEVEESEPKDWYEEFQKGIQNS